MDAAKIAEQQTKSRSRRRIGWLILSLFTLITATILALLVRQPDGLDFIRKYHPTAEILKTKGFSVGTRTGTLTETTWHRHFKFTTIPPELIDEIARKSDGVPRITPHSLDIDRFTWDKETGTVYVELGKPPPWLLQKWMALSDAILGR